MNRSPDHPRLSDDVIGSNQSARAASLVAGVSALRRKRARRRAVRAGGPMLALIVVAGWLSWRAPETKPKQSQPAQAPISTPVETIAGTPIRVIDDDELLKLFGDRPVAIVKVGGERRLVLFDEASADRTENTP